MRSNDGNVHRTSSRRLDEVENNDANENCYFFIIQISYLCCVQCCLQTIEEDVIPTLSRPNEIRSWFRIN